MKQKNILFPQLQVKLCIRMITQRKEKTAERSLLLCTFRQTLQLPMCHGSNFLSHLPHKIETQKCKARPLFKKKRTLRKKIVFEFRQFCH